MTYLLDTSALIDFSKGWEPARSNILALLEGQEAVGVCGVNIAEFTAGLLSEERAAWEQFFATLTYWDITRADAIPAGVWLHDYAKSGTTLSTTDTLIAAVAARVKATIVTDNTWHYPMPEVQTFSPRQQAA